MSRDITPADIDPVLFAPEHPARVRRVIFAVAVAFSAYQVYTAAFAPLSSVVMRALHVGFLLLLTFLMFPTFARHGRRGAWFGWLLGAVGVVVALYQWIFEADLIQRSGDLTVPDMVVGVTLIVLVFEAARRIMGIALPIICAGFSRTACSASISRESSRTADSASTRSSTRCRSAPRASTASRSTCHRRTSSCSSCSGRFSSRRA